MKNRIIFRNKSVVLLQKTIRGYLVRKKHQPRYRGIAKIKAVEDNLRKMHAIAEQLKADRDKMQANIRDVQASLTAAVAKIRANPSIGAPAIDQQYADIMRSIDTNTHSLCGRLFVI